MSLAQATGDWDRARAEILRLRAQQEETDQRAAAIIQEVADRLRSLHRLLDGDTSSEPLPAPVGNVGPHVAAQHWVKTDRPSEPPAGQQSPAMLRERATSLCAAILQATFVSAEDL